MIRRICSKKETTISMVVSLYIITRNCQNTCNIYVHL